MAPPAAGAGGGRHGRARLRRARQHLPQPARARPATRPSTRAPSAHSSCSASDPAGVDGAGRRGHAGRLPPRLPRRAPARHGGAPRGAASWRGRSPVIADAQIELGRYRDAARTIQRLVDLKPGLPAYARVSYYRELHGDVHGAVRAMRFAVSAGGGAEGAAYVRDPARRPRADARRGPAAARDAYRERASRRHRTSPRPSPDSRASTRRAGGFAGPPPALRRSTTASRSRRR